jgi:hypothetical protein
MAKKIKPSTESETQTFLDMARFLFALPVPKKYQTQVLPEYPFDLQLLNLSAIYRQSRKLYLDLGGRFFPRMCSTMRGLSAQDLFRDEIDYSPCQTELKWFLSDGHVFSDANEETKSLIRFNEISIFHEQNHRILWRILPPAPSEKADVYRYLNFAESIVVTLDMALSDQLGPVVSTHFEQMKVIYHPGSNDKYSRKPNKDYRNYLFALLTTTYFALETMHYDDVLNAVNYVLPGQKNINRLAVHRALQLSELFTRVTNPQWQNLNWNNGQKKLRLLQAKSKEKPLYLPADPLDLQPEFNIAQRVFDHFGL